MINKRGDIDELEIYRRLKVADVWLWQRGRFWTYRLTRSRYAEVERGAVLPDLDLGELSRVVASTDEPHQTEAVRAYRKALRSRG